MCLLTLSMYTGPDTYSVDHYLEKRISWWWKVAEFRNPVQQPVPVVPAPRAPVPVAPVIPAANGSRSGGRASLARAEPPIWRVALSLIGLSATRLLRPGIGLQGGTSWGAFASPQR